MLHVEYYLLPNGYFVNPCAKQKKIHIIVGKLYCLGMVKVFNIGGPKITFFEVAVKRGGALWRVIHASAIDFLVWIISD